MRFLRNLALIAVCYIYSIVRGTARKVPKKIENFAVMPASRLGDMVCATPIFHALKQHRASAKVTVVGLANCKDVHEGNPDVDRYVALDPNNFWVNVRTIRALKADVAIITSPSFEAVAMYFLAGLPLIIGPRIENGFSPYNTKSYRLMQKLFLPISHRMGTYAPREYLRMLEPLGVQTEDTHKHVYFSAQAGDKIRDFFAEHRLVPGTDFIVGMSVSAGNKIKRWDPRKFAALADWLSSQYKATIVFIAGAKEKHETAEALAHVASSTRYIDTSGLFSLDQLKACISKFDLFISVDTGPIYVAEALSIPTVDITGPIDPYEQPPIGKLHKVVHIVDRVAPELYVMNARVYNHAEAVRQTEAISVEMVQKAVREVIAQIQS